MGLGGENDFWAFVNVVLFAGWGGGRLVHLLFYEQPGRRLATLFSLNSGFSVLGGFLAIPLGVWAFARLKGKSFLVLYDHFSVAAPLAHAFGRVGCFLAACCHGRPTEASWGVAFTDPRSLVPDALRGAALHPVQLYEAAGNLLIAACLWPVLKSSRRPGLVTALY
jgi:phosphatidylglycerol---prolipoprotein diacylglyceryl transferase